MKRPDIYVHYMTISSKLDQRGMVCTTVGSQYINPNETYPPIGKHPEGYYFRKTYGRLLPEYQILYIAEGSGFFESAHIPKCHVSQGTVLLLFPNEWHVYAPTPNTGWKEYWVGFRGKGADRLMQEMMLTAEHPIIKVKEGIRIESLFDELIHNAEYELSGYQLLCTGLITHILGVVSYSQHSQPNINQNIAETIHKAQALMRNYIGKNISPEQVAEELGVGYSWFRQMFKKYVGTSPAQYQQLLRVQRAEFLLSNPTLSIADISYELGFANPNQFSTFFRLHKKISPLAFRRTLEI